MGRFTTFNLIKTALIFFIGCDTDRTPETFLLPGNFNGFFYIVYSQTDGQDEIFGGNRRLYKIPATGVLFTKFKNDWGSIKFENGVINQQFYFVNQIGERSGISVFDTHDFNNEATAYPKDEYYS